MEEPIKTEDLINAYQKVINGIGSDRGGMAESCCTQVGVVTLDDGRKAAVQLVVTVNEGDWIEDVPIYQNGVLQFVRK